MRTRTSERATYRTHHMVGELGASRSTVASRSACIKAARRIRDKVLHIAAHLLGETPEDLEMRDGVISPKRSKRSLMLQRVADVALRFSGQLPEGIEPGLDVVAHYELEAPTTCNNVTLLAMVDLDLEKGSSKLLKYFMVDDSDVLSTLLRSKARSTVPRLMA